MYLVSANSYRKNEEKAKRCIIQRPAISPVHLNLNVLGKLPDYIARGRVLAYIVLRRPITCVKNAAAGLDCATNLSGRLPDHLRKMRRDWIVGVVLGNFSGPRSDGIRDGKGSSAGGEILAKWPESAARMLKDASIGPLLRFGR